MGISAKISSIPLSIDKVYHEIIDRECGGVALFVGTVRCLNKGKDVTHLEFETYDSMALKEMEKIANYCIDSIGVKNLSIHHRSGTVGITEIAVIIGASSVHRDLAFEACQHAINTLKETVPIWKKEFLLDGSYWVGARP